MNICHLLPLAALSLVVSLRAEPLPDPKTFREKARLPGNSGEQFAWESRQTADDLVMGYEATGDPRWLDEAVVYFDWLIGKMKKDPDGYEGWIGPGVSGMVKWLPPGRVFDTIVGDARLMLPITRFSEIVLKDPKLTARHGTRAREYVDLATRVIWEKWNLRGTYYQDASGFGSYRWQPQFIEESTWKWVPNETFHHSENLNKHSDMALVLLRLWRITGREEFRQRAYEVFARLKTMFRWYPKDDRVSWNFWMPHGPFDLRVKDGVEQLSSWVAVHPNRAGYQAHEVANMVEAYDSGVAFDRADIQRLVNTNLFMLAARKADGKLPGSDGTGEGGVWSALARFDKKILEATRQSESSKKPIAKAYLENVVMKSRGANPLYVKNSAAFRVFDFKPQPGAGLSLTLAIPDRIETANHDEMRLATQARLPGNLTIELLDASGQNVLGVLHRAQASGKGDVILPRWDGTNHRTKGKEPGKYHIRWKLDGEVRTQPVWVETGSDHSRPVGPPAASDTPGSADE